MQAEDTGEGVLGVLEFAETMGDKTGAEVDLNGGRVGASGGEQEGILVPQEVIGVLSAGGPEGEVGAEIATAEGVGEVLGKVGAGERAEQRGTQIAERDKGPGKDGRGVVGTAGGADDASGPDGEEDFDVGEGALEERGGAGEMAGTEVLIGEGGEALEDGAGELLGVRRIIEDVQGVCRMEGTGRAGYVEEGGDGAGEEAFGGGGVIGQEVELGAGSEAPGVAAASGEGGGEGDGGGGEVAADG